MHKLGYNKLKQGATRTEFNSGSNNVLQQQKASTNSLFWTLIKFSVCCFVEQVRDYKNHDQSRVLRMKNNIIQQFNKISGRRLIWFFFCVQILGLCRICKFWIFFFLNFRNSFCKKIARLSYNRLYICQYSSCTYIDEFTTLLTFYLAFLFFVWIVLY